MSQYLTLDLGSTYFKAALFDQAGQLTSLSRIAVPIEHPRPGWYELPGDLFEKTIIQLLGQLRAQSEVGFDQVQAISFATQANSFRLLDQNDNALSPLILWLDKRATDMANKLDLISQGENYYPQTGISNLNGQMLLGQLMRFAQTNALCKSKQVKRVCLISDVLTLWMTGQHVTCASVAGLTGMADIHSLQWLECAHEATGLDVSCFGRIVPGGSDLGAIRATVASELGLPQSCRFVVGCLDQYAGAVGCGNIAPGGLSETTGTVLATVRCCDHFDVLRSDLFQGPGVVSGMYYQMDFGSRSANILEHYQRQLADRPSFAQLDALASDIPAGAEGLRVGDEPLTAKDMFVGRSKTHTPGHEVRAILETVVLALDQQVKHICHDDMPQAIVSAGGAAQSDLWQQIKADQLQLPFYVMQCPEPTSLGAAMLGAYAVQGTPIAQLAQSWIKKHKTYLPSG